MGFPRKYWLFAGSERGGEACAIVTSLIETAKAHGHDPLAYLTDVLECSAHRKPSRASP